MPLSFSESNIRRGFRLCKQATRSVPYGFLTGISGASQTDPPNG